MCIIYTLTLQNTVTRMTDRYKTLIEKTYERIPIQNTIYFRGDMILSLQ